MHRRTLLRAGAGLFIFDSFLLPDEGAGTSGSVFVHAGRRVDAPDAQQPRFPQKNVPLVHQRIRNVFIQEKPRALVSAAACGADLLALEVAAELQVRRVVLLPSPPEEFRRTSVVDRPGDWGTLFDRLVTVENLAVMPHRNGRQESYLAANLALLDRAQAMARQQRRSAVALVVWNGQSRGPDDVTGHFLTNARKRKLRVLEVMTL
jgi:hypothetical protein